MAGGALNINVVGGTFYQNTYLGPKDGPPNPAVFGVLPSMRFDTFVTIGVKSYNPNNPGVPEGQPTDAMVFSAGWPGFGGTSSLIGTNLSWSVTPADPQADPFNPAYSNGNGQVLIGQFTTVNGIGIVVKNLHILVRCNGVTLKLNAPSGFCVPSPGALALLGTAGLLRTRRRRPASGRRDAWS